jgi:hypothetical protein
MLGRTFPSEESAEQYAARFPLAWVTPVRDFGYDARGKWRKDTIGYHVTIADAFTLARLGLSSKAARVQKTSKER